MFREQHIDYISSKITRRRHSQAYKALYTKGIPTIALPYLDCIVWGQFGEALKDRLQTLQNKAALTIAKLRCDEANYGELLTEFG